MSRQAKHGRTRAQAAAASAFAAAGRASQARKRAAAIAKTGKPPPVSKRRHQAALKWAAAGRAAQARKRAGLKPLPVHVRALAGDPAVSTMGGAVSYMSPAAGEGSVPCDAWPAVGPMSTATYLMILAEANRDSPCCAATAIATHLYLFRGIMATADDILALHAAGGGDGTHGALLPDLLELASGGFAGTRIASFFPVEDDTLPGLVTGLRLPGGAHAVLSLGGAACVSWGQVVPATGRDGEAWWAEWE